MGCLVAALAPLGVRAQLPSEERELEPVVVTATRVPQRLQHVPIGASVITAEQIERAGVSDVNEAIRKLGGVAARSDLNNGRDHILDLRGFGETANENLVVLVDGIRLSENEQRGARLSAIPLSQIDRIEIIRGSASVLWGEGAASGVINVILKQGAARRSQARVSAGIESFNGREVQSDGQWVHGDWVVEGGARHLSTDGYRDNSDYQQATGNLGLQWRNDRWQVKLRVQQDDQDVRLPGALTFERFHDNPEQTVTPNDAVKVRDTLTTAHVRYTVDAWTAAIDIGAKEMRDEYLAPTPPYPYLAYTNRARLQIAPRLVHEARLDDLDVTTVVGLDWQRWTFDKQTNVGDETGKQLNRAVYGHVTVNTRAGTRVTAGLRHESVRKDGHSGAASYHRPNALRAWELAASQTVAPGWDVYGRSASSYRLPNIDENRYTPQSLALRPQRSKDAELGLKWAGRGHSLGLRRFVQDTVDEIAFDSSLFVNANSDPTRRRGVELEGRWSPTQALTLSATWQQVSARYADGPNAGRERVLTAPHTATLRAAWRVDPAQTVDVGAQYLSRMRFGDDVSNECGRRIPSSTLLDASYAWSRAGWTVSVSGKNLTDERVYNYAFSCALGNLYPEPRRSVKVAVARQF